MRCEFKMITMGGNAEIELIDSMDPFSEGESMKNPHRLNVLRSGALDHAAQEELARYCESFWWRKGQ